MPWCAPHAQSSVRQQGGETVPAGVRDKQSDRFNELIAARHLRYELFAEQLGPVSERALPMWQSHDAGGPAAQ